MQKLTLIKDKQGEAYTFHCPGCDMMHMVPVKYAPEYANRNGKPKPTWKFNGDMESPTFIPSYRIEWNGAEPPQRCHVIIRNGELIYLIDTTHRLSGARTRMIDV